ncbi:MAG: tetratricopeptide repeat protein [Candidatus Omnitrophica bacterium]|nr:tetratricopeptide repeat protein [Candidatus Omnitrophota bacterium]
MEIKKRYIIEAVAVLIALGVIAFLGWRKMAVIFYNRGIDHYDRGEYSESIQYLQRALGIDPDNTKIHYTLANAYIQTEDQDKAIQEYKRTLELSGDYAPAYLNLAQLYLNRQAYEQLFEIIVQAKENDRFTDELAEVFRDATFQYASDHVSMGIEALMSNNRKQGYVYLEKAIKIDPDFAYPSYVAGFFYYRDQDYQRARELAQDAIKIDSRFGAAYKLLGDIQFCQRDFPAAIQEYGMALQFNYINPYLQNDLALALMEEGEYQDALRHAKAAVGALPENVNMLYNLACLYRDNADTQSAISEFNRLIAGHPDYPNAHNDLADIYLSVGRTSDAEKAYLKEIEYASVKLSSDPKDAVALNSLARGYNGVKKYELARGFAQDAIKNMPNYREAYVTLAKIQENLGDPKGAQVTLKQGESITAKAKYIPQAVISLDDIILDQNYTVGIDGLK